MDPQTPLISVTLQQALSLFPQINIKDIRDIRALDTDLLLVLRGGQRIVWVDGSLLALQDPGMVIVFKDGTLRVEQIFKQIEAIELNKPEVADEPTASGTTDIPIDYKLPMQGFEIDPASRWWLI